MKSKDFLDAIGAIDSEFIEEAEVTKKIKYTKRNSWYRGAFAVAACFLLVVGVINYHISILHSGYVGNTDGGGEKTAESVTQEPPAVLFYKGEEYELVKDSDRFTMIEGDEVQEQEKEIAMEPNKERLGELGEKGTVLYADNGLTGITVYKLQKDDLMVEFLDQQYVYRKRSHKN